MIQLHIKQRLLTGSLHYTVCLNFMLFFFFSFSTALFCQMMDERFPIDNGTNMTNHQEDGTHTHTSVEV